jgi:hypothetical protein
MIVKDSTGGPSGFAPHVVPEASEAKRFTVFEVNPHRDFSLPLLPPLVKTIRRCAGGFRLVSLGQCFGTRIDHPVFFLGKRFT